jgi:hypothetical protein
MQNRRVGLGAECFFLFTLNIRSLELGGSSEKGVGEAHISQDGCPHYLSESSLDQNQTIFTHRFC